MYTRINDALFSERDHGWASHGWLRALRGIDPLYGCWPVDRSVPFEWRPGVIIYPRGFQCSECGCTETREGPGFVECAWCRGRGRHAKT